MSRAALPASAQGPVMHYTINIDARGGANTESIRRVVRVELETHRRQLQARTRSSLADVD